jgi:hypothetical protein
MYSAMVHIPLLVCCVEQCTTYFDFGTLLSISGAVAGVVPLSVVLVTADLLLSASLLEYLPSKKHTTAASSK